MRETLVFELTTKELLNSNNMPTHYAIKAKMASDLRNAAAEAGIARHPEGEARELAQARYELIQQEAKLTLAKSRKRKALNKKAIGLPDFDVEAEMAKAFEGKELSEKSADAPVTHLFDVFKVIVTVLPPSRRRLDPPNLYPTVKALIDGLTDASWWEDDNFLHLVETSFRYGGLSGIKGKFKVVLTLEEVEDASSYNRLSEIALLEV